MIKKIMIILIIVIVILINGIHAQVVPDSFCLDNDGDGFYDDTQQVCYLTANTCPSMEICNPCVLPENTSGGDCNDNNALINPNGSDLCYNGEDWNCDGKVADCNTPECAREGIEGNPLQFCGKDCASTLWASLHTELNKDNDGDGQISSQGCGEDYDDTDPEKYCQAWIDNDGDGYVKYFGGGQPCKGTEDCDDTDSEIYPQVYSNQETGVNAVTCYDHRKDNKDGDPSKGIVAPYYGNNLGILGGEQGPDCDDTDPEIYPSEEEITTYGGNASLSGIIRFGPAINSPQNSIQQKKKTEAEFGDNSCFDGKDNDCSGAADCGDESCEGIVNNIPIPDAVLSGGKIIKSSENGNSEGDSLDQVGVMGCCSGQLTSMMGSLGNCGVCGASCSAFQYLAVGKKPFSLQLVEGMCDRNPNYGDSILNGDVVKPKSFSLPFKGWVGVCFPNVDWYKISSASTNEGSEIKLGWPAKIKNGCALKPILFPVFEGTEVKNQYVIKRKGDAPVGSTMWPLSRS